MHTVVGETDAETSIHLTEYGQFLPDGSTQLVAIGSKLLRLFRVNPYVRNGIGEFVPQLECVAQFSFIAPVVALTKIRLPSFQFDCIVTCFDDAKIAVQYICPAKRDLEIVSLHEIHPDVLGSVFEKLETRSFIQGDPERRCVIALVRDAFFMVIPIPEKLGPEFFDEWEDDANHGSRRLRPKLTHFEIKLHDLDKRLHNVSDFVIPSGHYVPTAIVLFEPKKNTAGRAQIAYDTFCISAISFDLKERQTAVTWQVSGLPMSLQRMIHIPEPVNGIFLAGVNELIYVHQYAPGFGVSLNSNASGFSRFSLHEADINTLLDGVVVELLSPYEIVLGNRNGELYIATIDTDAMNSVRSISVQRVFDIPIPSSIVNLSPGYLFIASKISNCALLAYEKKCGEKILPTLEQVKVVEMASNLENEDFSAEEYEKAVSHHFYGETTEEIAILEAPITPQQYTFTRIQTLLNTAPFKKICLCVAEEIDDVFKDEVRDQVFDVAAATGHDFDGKVTFHERTVRPVIGSTLPMKAISCCFTVGRLNDENRTHRYLFLSRELGTTVLDSMKNLSEHHQTPFCMNEGTIMAGDLINGSVTCQVTVYRIMLVKEQEIIFETQFDPDGDVFVMDAAICDPYIAITLNTEQLIVYHVQNDENGSLQLSELATNAASEHSLSKTTCLTIYRDESGLFKTRAADNSNALPQPYIIADIDDDISPDALFEGADEVSKSFYVSTKVTEQRESNVSKNRRLRTSIIDREFDNWQAQTCSSVRNPDTVEPYYVLILAREDGSLYFYSLPDFQLVYVIPKANCIWTTLVDDPYFGTYNSSFGFNLAEENGDGPASKRTRPVVMEGLLSIHASRICEVQLFGTGPNGCRPVLGILVDDVVTLFEAFPFDNFLDGHLMVRFKKMDRYVCVRRQPFIVDDKKTPVETISLGVKIRPRYINFATKMGSMENVIVVTGGYPTVIYVGNNGTFHHPLSIDGPIRAFSYLCTPLIPHGFVYAKDEVMRIGELGQRFPAVEYDTPYPCRVVPMKANVSDITYILPFNLFVVATSLPEEYSSIWTVNNDEQIAMEVKVHERFKLPIRHRFTVRLFTREDYAFIPNNEMEFKDFEIVTCVEEVIISALGSKTGLMNYIAIGTAFNMGEEVPAKGRLLMYEIIEVVPEIGRPTTRYKWKLVSELDQKGCVSSISSTEGVLMVAVGQRVFIYTLKDEGLVASSFLDFKFYVSQMCPLRSLSLCVDMFTSVHLVRYQKEFKVLSEIAADDRRICPRPHRAGFVINNEHVAFVLSDMERNLVVMEHVPDAPESKFAQRLLIRGGIRIGAVISNFVRVHAHVVDSMVTRLQTTFAAQSTMFTTKEGSWGFVRPVAERSYRRLFMLQNFIETQFQQLGGLNARGARAIRPQITGNDVSFATARQLIDGDLLVQFFNVDSHDKDELARKLGTTKYQINDDLTELMRVVRHF